MKNNYSKSTLNNWSKKELVEYCLMLQENLNNEQDLNNHMYNTMTAAMHQNPDLSQAICDVLSIWNKSSGSIYIKE